MVSNVQPAFSIGQSHNNGMSREQLASDLAKKEKELLALLCEYIIENSTGHGDPKAILKQIGDLLHSIAAETKTPGSSGQG